MIKYIDHTVMDAEDIIDELIRLRNELDMSTSTMSKADQYRFSYTSLAICEAIKSVYNLSVLQGSTLYLSEEAEYVLAGMTK